MTKQIEKFLHVVLILTLISILLGLLWTFLLAKMLSPNTFGNIKLFQMSLAWLFFIPKALVGLCVACWLWSLSWKYGFNPTAWFVFGLFLGVIALVVFYLVRIHDMLEAQLSKPVQLSSA